MNRILPMCLAIALLLFSFSEAAQVPDYIYLFDSRNPDIENWKNKFEDGSPTNANIYLKKYKEGHLAVIEATYTEDSFGCVYWDVAIDLDKYPILEIDVHSVSKYWYVVIVSEELEGEGVFLEGKRFVRVQYDTASTGKYRYNLKDITGLTGEQDFRLKIGVATGDVYSPTENEAMSFSYLRLVGQK